MSDGGRRGHVAAIKVFALALLLAIASAAVLWGAGAAQQVASEGRSKIPGTVEFDGEARRYDVLVSRAVAQGDDTPERLAPRVRCGVTGAGDPIAEIRGDRQGTSTVTDFGATIGSFDGRAGRRSVSCRRSQDRYARGVTNKFVIAEQQSGLRYAAFGGFGVAALLGLVGLLLVRRSSPRKPV